MDNEPDFSGRLGVFGGSFDPIHVGHLIVAEILCHRLELARVLFLPTGRPPHKPDRVLTPDADRIAMLELAIAGTPYFTLSRIDVDRAGASYTSDSLRFVRAAYPDTEDLYFLMGQDSLRDFPTWNRPSEIARLARLGVARRPNVVVDRDEIVRKVPELAGRIDLVDVPLIGISSSEIRRRVREREPFRFQVLPEVADYIQEHGLYRRAATGPASLGVAPNRR